MAIALSVSLPRVGRAAIALGARAQESSRNSTNLTAYLTVPNTPNTVLLAGVNIAGNATAAQVTWGGLPLTRLQAVNSNPGGCRVEIWVLLNPMPGDRGLQVVLDSPSAFGVGAASYTGVDRSRVTVESTLTGTSPTIVLAAGGSDRQALFGTVCVSGSGNAGAPVQNQTVLWDFTEPGVIGLGGHRMTTPLSLSWTLQQTARWTAATVLLSEPGFNPSVDAGMTPDMSPVADGTIAPPDLGSIADAPAAPPDLGSVVDAPVTPIDVSAPPPDAATDADTRPPGSAADADVGDGASEGGAIDNALPIPGAGGVGSDGSRADGGSRVDADDDIRPVHLQVGCACDTGSPARNRSPFVELFLALCAFTWLRRRRR